MESRVEGRGVHESGGPVIRVTTTVLHSHVHLPVPRRDVSRNRSGSPRSTQPLVERRKGLPSLGRHPGTGLSRSPFVFSESLVILEVHFGV